jgi:hypothetical protein
VSTSAGWNPGRTFCSARKLRISSPAPTSSTTDSATSATMRNSRILCRPGPPAPRKPPWRAACGSAAAERSAGTSAKTTTVASVTPRAKPSTDPSTAISANLGRLAGRSVRSTAIAQNVSVSPSPPAAAARIPASVSTCRSMAPRLAPSAARRANSPSRAVARVSSRLATLAQAMSSTSATAPMSSSSAGRACLTTSWCSGTTRMRRLEPACTGCSARSWAASPSISAWAWAQVRPSASRPKTVNPVKFRGGARP